MDIGPQTIQAWSADFQKAATVFWNGPVGVFEFPHFARGTQEMAKAIAGLKANTIVGGGDSVAAINQLGLAQNSPMSLQAEAPLWNISSSESCLALRLYQINRGNCKTPFGAKSAHF